MKKRVLIIGVALTGVSIFASDNGNFPGHKLAENIKFEERFSAAAEEPVGNEDGCRSPVLNRSQKPVTIISK